MSPLRKAAWKASTVDAAPRAVGDSALTVLDGAAGSWAESDGPRAISIPNAAARNEINAIQFLPSAPSHPAKSHGRFLFDRVIPDFFENVVGSKS